MIKYLLKIIVFFAIVAVVDYCVGCLGDYLQANAKGGPTRQVNDLVMKDCHDIIILGSSRAHHHYDTPFLSDTLGLNVYNAGYDGNGVVLSYGLVELLLERYHPKLIIYDVEPAFDVVVYSGDNNHIRYLSRLKPYYRHLGIEEVFKDVSNEEWYKVHSGLIRYNSNLFSLFLDNVRQSPMDLQGYAPSRGVYSGEIPEESGEKTGVDHFKLKYVENLIKLAQTNNIRIILVASPKYGVKNSIVFKPIKEICAKYNVEFWDFYTTEDFQKPFLFKEPMHLNSDGARLFSSQIANKIREKFIYN